MECQHLTTNIKILGERYEHFNGTYEMQPDLCNKKFWYKNHMHNVLFFNLNTNQWCISNNMLNNNPSTYSYFSYMSIFEKLNKNFICDKCVPLGACERFLY